jgi:thioredoxin reductase (NADPH)
MSSYLVDRVTNTPNVELLANTEVRELIGGDRLDGVMVENGRSGELHPLGVRSLFVFIGADANTGWLEGTVVLDERGFVRTGAALDRPLLGEEDRRQRSRQPFLLETSMPGVFAAGDARSGSIKRCASAVGEGAMAVRLVHQYLSGEPG